MQNTKFDTKRVIRGILSATGLSIFLFCAQMAVADEPEKGMNATNIPINELSESAQAAFIASAETESIIRVTDDNFSGSGTIVDCQNGWASDIWELTLTGDKNSKRIVNIRVSDEFLVGDYFEVYIDGDLYDITDKVELFGPEYSVGEYSIPLKLGTHQFKIRDAAYDDFDSDTLSFMCPAGFSFEWTLGDTVDPIYTGVIKFVGQLAKKISLTAGEFIAELKGFGPVWDGIAASWTIKKGADFHDQMTDQDLRAQAIDEAYNSEAASSSWKSKVDLGVQLYCDSCSGWNDLAYEQKRDDELFTLVCSSVGGGYCSGWILPQGAAQIFY